MNKGIKEEKEKWSAGGRGGVRGRWKRRGKRSEKEEKLQKKQHCKLNKTHVQESRHWVRRRKKGGGGGGGEKTKQKNFLKNQRPHTTENYNKRTTPKSLSFKMFLSSWFNQLIPAKIPLDIHHSWRATWVWLDYTSSCTPPPPTPPPA